MEDIILYPTETVYGLGVNVLSESAQLRLIERKGRDINKAMSWLVRDVEDIEHFAVYSKKALEIARHFMPGPLTLVLPVKEDVPSFATAFDHTVGFRISSDEKAQKLIREFMDTYGAPLTCTSANVSGQSTLTTPESIIEQFKSFDKKFIGFSEVVDDGPRSGVPSTIIKVVGEEVLLIREGAIPFRKLSDFI